VIMEPGNSSTDKEHSVAKDHDSQRAQRPYTLSGIRALARILDQFQLTSLEVDQGGQRIHLTRDPGTGHGAPPLVQGPAAAGPAQGALAEGEVAKEEPERGVVVTSPFVGTFYRAPGPGASPFVEVGQTVKPGQVLCIVEAMKLMNEIEAEQSFEILEILASNGDPVEFGQALFRMQPVD